MRKYAIPALTLVVALAIGAVAYAAQVNTYTVTGSTKPSKTKKASKKKPIPVGLKFSYKVGEASGQRPSPVKKYAIAFDGLTQNSRRFPACSGKKIEAAIKDKKLVRDVCKKARVGGGFVKNATGSSSNPADRSIRCDLSLDLYNEGADRLGLHLYGSPPQCAIDVNEVIHARFVKRGIATSLEFTVKPLLLHPLAGLDNAVEDVRSTVKLLKRKHKGKTIGYFQAVGGCKKGKRGISVTFTGENGQKTVARSKAAC